MTDTLSADELNAITIIERVGSVFSLLGCLFIIGTFAGSKAFHKPINRLVFYASFGNMMTNVGTLMARSYLESLNSFGCQFQGFLIQMFMPADALWTLAMAVNVYLTFYYKFDAERLRQMEIWYILLCYGVPFVPALTYVFVTTEDKGRMYGNATLWCWVSSGWDIFRIATFYGPVWVVILVTFFIYLRAGREIYNKRKQLLNFSSTHEPEPLTMDDPFSTKTTEVMVTTEVIEEDPGAIDLAPMAGGRDTEAAASHNPAYSVTISSSIRGNRQSVAEFSLPIQNNDLTQVPAPVHRNNRTQKRRANFEANNAAWSYTKCAVLFFTALLITWIPSSANRVFSVIHPGEISKPLEFMSALVLPLQGFWNAAIYLVTSWAACKLVFFDLLYRTKNLEPISLHPDANNKRNAPFKIQSRSSTKNYETESMTELAMEESRPSSNEEPKRSM